MGKIGDLIARLKLDGSQYDKGIKTAKNSTNTFSQGLKGLLGTGASVWTALGAGAVEFGKEVIASNQQLGDSFAKLTSELKAGWTEFVRSVASWDFSDFGAKISNAMAAAGELAAARDGLFESTNAAKMFEMINTNEMVQLEEIFRNTQLSDAERIAAGKELLRLRREAYEIQRKDLDLISKASVKNFLVNTKASGLDNATELLQQFILSYQSNNEDFVNAIKWLAGKNVKWDENGQITIRQDSLATYVDQYGNRYSYIKGENKKIEEASAELKQNFSNAITEVARLLERIGIEASAQNIMAFADLGITYEKERNDGDVSQLLRDMYESRMFDSKFYAENRRITSQVNILETKQAKANAPIEIPVVPTIDTKELDDIIKELDKEFVEDIKNMDLTVAIDVSGVDQALVEMEKFGASLIAQRKRVEDLNKSLNSVLQDATISLIDEGIQSISDALFNLEGADSKSILAAILRPFASFAKSMGALLIAYGLSMDAFKKAFATPWVAVAAGAALIATGAAITSGISAFNKTQSTSGASAASASGYTPEANNAKNEITVYVKGRLSGSDIVISGQNTLNQWAR